MNKELIFNYIKNYLLFREIPEDAIQKVASIITVVEKGQDEVVVNEGDESDDLYLLVKGEVEIYKGAAHKNKKSFLIARAKTGSYFGELSFADSRPRSATIKTATASKFFLISKKQLFALENGKNIFKKMVYNIANRGKLFLDLRTTNDNLISALQKEKMLLEKQNEFGSFFILSIFQVLLVVFINHFIDYFKGQFIYDVWFNWVYLIILAVPFFVYIYRFDLSFKRFGFNARHLRQTVVESLLCVTALFVALFCFQKNAFMSWQFSFKPYASLVFLSYSFSSIIQEFIRVVFQTSLSKFYNKKSSFDIFAAAFLFGALHIHFGLFAVLATFLFACLMGWFYNRHGNIIGISFMHALIGYAAYAVNLI